MPPKCPQCGRFLSNAFIRALLDEPATCPRCGTTLNAEQFSGSDALAMAPPDGSVRPPDLPPESVRPTAEERDVLEGWDQPAEVIDLQARRGVPEPAVADRLRAMAVVMAAGVVGALLGALILRRHRRLGAILGTFAASMASRSPGAAAGRRP